MISPKMCGIRYLPMALLLKEQNTNIKNYLNAYVEAIYVRFLLNQYSSLYIFNIQYIFTLTMDGENWVKQLFKRENIVIDDPLLL